MQAPVKKQPAPQQIKEKQENVKLKKEDIDDIWNKKNRILYLNSRYVLNIKIFIF